MQGNSKQPIQPTERAESRLLVAYAFDLARKLGISKVLVLADLLQDRRTVESQCKEESIIWVVWGDDIVDTIQRRRGDHRVEIPEAGVGRMDQLKLGLIMAVLLGAVGASESVVCLTGVAGSKRLDSLLIANPSRDFPWFANQKVDTSASLLGSKVFARVLDIALRFAVEGREGKPIGTTFVLGEPSQLEKHTRALILNPFAGHARKARNVHSAELVESLRELASLDGAFIIDGKGVVEQAAVYLDAPLCKKVKVPKGLGARHTAAAAVSSAADAVSIVISESSGIVTVFARGAVVLEIGRN